LRFASGDDDWRRRIYDQFGADLYERFAKVRKDIEAMLTQHEAGEDEADAEGGEAAKPKVAEKTRKRLLDELTWDRDKRILEAARKLADRMGPDLYPDHNAFRERFDATTRELSLKLGNADRKAILEAVSWRDPEAPPVIKKTRKDGTTEYEPDTELRDTEQVPFLEAPPSGLPGGLPSEASAKEGIDAFFKRECLPYVPDAWIDESKTKIGYEISFTRYFYKPKALRGLDEIKADILAADKESEGLLAKIVGKES